MSSSSPEKSLSLLRRFPRLSLHNLSKLPGHMNKTEKMPGGRKNNYMRYRATGNKSRALYPALGYEAGNSPFTKTTPLEPSYNYGYQ